MKEKAYQVSRMFEPDNGEPSIYPVAIFFNPSTAMRYARRRQRKAEDKYTSFFVDEIEVEIKVIQSI